VVICLEHGADLRMALPLTVSCFCKIQIGFTLLVPAHVGSPGKRAVKRVCVYVVGCTGLIQKIEFLTITDSNICCFTCHFSAHSCRCNLFSVTVGVCVYFLFIFGDVTVGMCI